MMPFLPEAKTKRPARKQKSTKSHVEDLFFSQCQSEGLPLPERQVRLIPQTRKDPANTGGKMTRHKVDFVWKDARVVLEVQGGTWSGGRHTRGKGYEGDCWKMAHLQLEGFTVYFATSGQVKRGEALSWIAEALGIERRSKAKSKPETDPRQMKLIEGLF